MHGVYIQLVGEGRRTYYLIDKSGSIGIKYEYEGGIVSNTLWEGRKRGRNDLKQTWTVVEWICFFSTPAADDCYAFHGGEYSSDFWSLWSVSICNSVSENAIFCDWQECNDYERKVSRDLRSLCSMWGVYCFASIRHRETMSIVCCLYYCLLTYSNCHDYYLSLYVSIITSWIITLRTFLSCEKRKEDAI